LRCNTVSDTGKGTSGQFFGSPIQLKL
jgi:hypothetical protein